MADRETLKLRQAGRLLRALLAENRSVICLKEAFRK